MPPFGRSGQDSVTAQRLLDAAAHEFARHGYVATRIRDIVDAAGANLAAVNYHFGGKEGLYQATLAQLARAARDDDAVDSPELRAMPPEDQLRAFARVMLMRYLGAGPVSPLSRMIAPELLAPTPAIGQILTAVSGPQWARLAEIVRAILGPLASEDDVTLASFSAASQWAFLLFGRRLFEFQSPALASAPGLVDRLADHIASSSIAAMLAIRLRLEKEQAAQAAQARPVPAAGRANLPRGGLIEGGRPKSARSSK